MTFISSKNKGFRMEFDNGFSVSVQWGIGNYCEKQTANIGIDPTNKRFWESTSAEVAVFDKNNNMVSIGNRDIVIGWLSANEVAKIISIVSSASESITTKEEGHKEIQSKIKSLNL